MCVLMGKGRGADGETEGKKGAGVGEEDELRGKRKGNWVKEALMAKAGAKGEGCASTLERLRWDTKYSGCFKLPLGLVLGCWHQTEPGGRSPMGWGGLLLGQLCPEPQHTLCLPPPCSTQETTTQPQLCSQLRL